MAQVLKPGTQGEQVKELQSKLKQLGFQIESDGHFGPGTRAAVEDVQSLFGYDVDGVAGEATQQLLTQQVSAGFQLSSAEAVKRGLEAQGKKSDKGLEGPKLKRVLQSGMEGPDVRYLQRRLRALGYEVAVDGKYGPATDKAVRALQQAFGYNVDGTFGEATDRLVYQQIGYGFRAGATAPHSTRQA
jgi:peptidoglycan hydrolase-like protein with peptidoglycan-binding domain